MVEEIDLGAFAATQLANARVHVAGSCHQL